MGSPAAAHDSASVKDARARYFADNGFGEDGGYGAKWVKLKFGPIPVRFPNTQARVAAVKLHDLHHVATGYDTSLAGEAKIGAWEIASGCGRYSAAWILNLYAMSYGLWLCPRRLFRAFVRGRRSGNLYHGAVVDGALLDSTVAALVERLHIPTPTAEASAADAAAFAGWSVVGAAQGLASLLLLAGLAWGLVGLLV